jgi:drug/metabolite transporter (DMT)-like permease
MNHGKPANLALEVAWLLVLALLWGSSYLFIKIAVSDIPPITLIAFRVSVAAPF